MVAHFTRVAEGRYKRWQRTVEMTHCRNDARQEQLVAHVTLHVASAAGVECSPEELAFCHKGAKGFPRSEGEAGRGYTWRELTQTNTGFVRLFVVVESQYTGTTNGAALARTSLACTVLLMCRRPRRANIARVLHASLPARPAFRQWFHALQSPPRCLSTCSSPLLPSGWHRCAGVAQPPNGGRARPPLAAEPH
jgi:hypothetical protein